MATDNHQVRLTEINSDEGGPTISTIENANPTRYPWRFETMIFWKHNGLDGNVAHSYHEEDAIRTHEHFVDVVQRMITIAYDRLNAL